MDNRPDFVIIGAMKCATTTLHDQLARQQGVFMSTPKEPNFFSDDGVWSRGIGWYESLFRDAPGGALRGESSTHYTKLPTYPETIDRFAEHLPDAKLIYVMRDPVARLVSQYIHEWSEARISVPIDEAVERHPELLDYSRYATQLRPWLDRFGSDRVLPVFFERITARPAAEFERVCRFVGVAGEAGWAEDAAPRNVSSERIRKNPVRDAVLDLRAMRWLRRALLPESVRERIKSRWRMDERPELSEGRAARVRERLDPDIAALGGMLGLRLNCEGFRDAVLGCEG
ncbi:MAG: sulfotransferase, partial [Planctomycetota bacterium]